MDFVEKLQILAFLITFCLCYCSCKLNHPNEQDILPDDWVDPMALVQTKNDHFNKLNKKDNNGKKKSKKKRKKEKKNFSTFNPASMSADSQDMFSKKCSTTCDFAHLKQLTRIILETFTIPGKRNFLIYLTDDDFKHLEEFKNGKDEKVAHAVEIISKFFLHAPIDDVPTSESIFIYLAQFVSYHNGTFAVAFVMVVILSLLILFEIRTSMPWYRQCWYVFGLLFLISIPWEWFRLYKQSYARKQVEYLKEIPKQCLAAKNMAIMDRISVWIAGSLTWKQDDCIKYQEAILIDPIWEISPSVALSTTATRLIFHPLEYIAASCGESLNAFLSKIPSMWQPVMVVIITIILLFCIFLLIRSRTVPVVTNVALTETDIKNIKNCIVKEIRTISYAPNKKPKEEGDFLPIQEEKVEELSPVLNKGKVM